MAHQDVQASVEGNFLQLEVEVVEGFQEESPNVDAGASAVVAVEPRVDDKDGTEPHAVRDGLGERRIVVEAQGVQSEPVQRRRGFDIWLLQRRCQARFAAARRDDRHLPWGVARLLLDLHHCYTLFLAIDSSVVCRSTIRSAKASLLFAEFEIL